MRITLSALDASSLSPYHEPPKLVIAVIIPEDSVSSFRCSTRGSNSLIPSEPERGWADMIWPVRKESTAQLRPVIHVSGHPSGTL